MDLFRKLVYENKLSLDAFEINKDGSPNQLLYDEWLLTKKELHGEDQQILAAFNDAYYLCTMALLIPERKYRATFAVKNVHIPSVALPLTHFYLSCIENLPRGTKRFKKTIQTVLGNDGDQNLKELENLVGKYKCSLILDEFTPRIITEELLSTISDIEWQNATDKYNKNMIQFYVTTLAKDRNEWNILIKAIRAAAEKYDYEYGFEDFFEEGFDIDGPYTRKMKVPMNPYDNEGNYILEPLKRAGVFQFCDDLMEKYDDLLSAKHNTNLGIGKKNETQPAYTQKRNQEDKTIFHINLNTEKIAVAIHRKVNSGNYKGKRSILKTTHEVLKEIGWLVDDIQTHFLEWAKANNIYAGKTMHFKNVKSDVDKIEIQNVFTELLPNGRLKDKDEFYRKNQQGDYLKKINNGE